MVALGKIVKPQAAAAAECNWSNEHLRLPPLPPSSLPGCNIIDIVYHLLFSVSFKGATSDLELKLPIVVGTIPTAVSGSLPTEPADASGLSAAPPPLPGGCEGSEASQGLPLGLPLPMAPPTYQQATAAWVSDAMEDVGGVPASSEGGAAEDTQASAPPATFLPFYVTYDFQDPSSPAVPQQSLLKPPVS
ncbi:arrestin domain-containing protein 1-like [Hyalella azteca]|uniref:Arrestin domain-containing protein 1-like n=1 Tax=Hyalella azteca TaxID=294128 RepID=A0A8B7NVH3_HYAAZ|nr:arrestin domain-containing protein 1-like [Hyalella azteca]